MKMDDTGYLDNKFIVDKPCSNIPSNPFDELRKLKKKLCFNGYYIAFLLGQHTEEEFQKISKKFIEK